MGLHTKFTSYAAGFGLAGLLALGSFAPAEASVVATITERPTDLLLTIEGSLDLTSFGTPVLISNPIAINGFVAAVGDVAVRNPSQPSLLRFNLTGGFADFGGGGFSFGAFLTGDNVSFEDNGSAGRIVSLPSDYVSGEALFAQAVISGSIASRGLTVGSFLSPLPDDQSLTVIVQPLSTVPLPAALPLLLTGLGALALARSRRARRG